jgi:hypothetical protein
MEDIRITNCGIEEFHVDLDIAHLPELNDRVDAVCEEIVQAAHMTEEETFRGNEERIRPLVEGRVEYWTEVLSSAYDVVDGDGDPGFLVKEDGIYIDGSNVEEETKTTRSKMDYGNGIYEEV